MDKHDSGDEDGKQLQPLTYYLMSFLHTESIKY